MQARVAGSLQLEKEAAKRYNFVVSERGIGSLVDAHKLLRTNGFKKGEL
jgi:hypothetical protein